MESGGSGNKNYLTNLIFLPVEPAVTLLSVKPLGVEASGWRGQTVVLEQMQRQKNGVCVF